MLIVNWVCKGEKLCYFTFAYLLLESGLIAVSKEGLTDVVPVSQAEEIGRVDSIEGRNCNGCKLYLRSKEGMLA